MSLLMTRGLKKHFGATRAVDGVDLSVAQGDVIALVGANGAGKTTLVNLVSGLLYPDEGEIFLDEVEVTHMPVHRRIKTGIARSFQLVNLFDQLTCLDNVALAIFSRDGKTRSAVSLAGKHGAVWDEAELVLEQFGLGGKAAALAAELAEGERKLLDVGIACALRPRLLLLDEPTSGVSTRDKAPIMDVITSVVRAQTITAVIIEHDMDIVFRYSERIVVMHEGRVLADGPPTQIQQDQRVATTLFGAPLSG